MKSATRIDDLKRRIENVVTMLTEYATQKGMALEFDSPYKCIKVLKKENE